MAPEDAPAVAALEKTSRARPWTEKVIRDELDAPGRIYLAADSESGLVGFGGVMVVGEEAHVTNLLVTEAVRRRGIGRKLLVSLIESAIDSGARHVTLEVRSRNAAAIALYSSIGLAPVGARPGYYIDDDALIMWAHDIDLPSFREGLG
jgi:ribosomal-protein-alanine N-acetyltransferase